MTATVGVPAEIKDSEHRVAIRPATSLMGASNGSSPSAVCTVS